MGGKKMGGAGLRGQSAGETSICTVGVTWLWPDLSRL